MRIATLFSVLSLALLVSDAEAQFRQGFRQTSFSFSRTTSRGGAGAAFYGQPQAAFFQAPAVYAPAAVFAPRAFSAPVYAPQALAFTPRVFAARSFAGYQTPAVFAAPRAAYAPPAAFTTGGCGVPASGPIYAPTCPQNAPGGCEVNRSFSRGFAPGWYY